MRILIVCPKFHPDIGGIESVVWEQSNGMADRGHEVTVLTTTRDRAAVGEEMLREGLVIRRFRGWSPGDAYHYSRSLGKAVATAAQNVDLIHAHGYHALPALQAFSNRRGKPFVFSAYYHRHSHKRFRNLLLRIHRRRARGMVEGSDLVLSISAAEKDLLEQDFAPRLSLVNHVGFEPGPAPPEGSRDDRRFCVVGRLESYKNVELALESAGRIDGIRLDIVGDGPDRVRLSQLIERLDLTDRVVLHGFVSEEEKGSIIGSADAMLALSDHESFGIVLLEAAHRGTPVIANDIGSHRELAAILGSAVHLVDAHDPAALDGAIRIPASERGSYEPSVMERFSWRRNVDELERLCLQVVGSEND